ncbi:MAG: hypothetical protein ACK40H_09300 [Sphingomonadaceae bacterium]
MIAPFFEEMNRTRRLLAQTGVALAALGIESWLPDLPGTGDHEGGSEAMDWASWRGAVAALAATMPADATLAVRGGALLDDAAGDLPRYRLAPASGAALMRDLLCARAATEAEAGSGLSVAALEARLAAGETVEAAGYPLSPALAAALRSAEPAPLRPGDRMAVLAGTEGGDIVLPGPPPWRSAEAADVRALAEALAQDIDSWLGAR